MTLGLGATQVAAARYFQRKGLTFTEIAVTLSVSREAVVRALYYDVARMVAA